ncbi:MAG TPA: PEGA domain-containing protein [Candidatus Deferrimicrobium sp.]|nr:PEGA domain-containing protein [Candidatus Deferrimicrobium sp.]
MNHDRLLSAGPLKIPRSTISVWLVVATLTSFFPPYGTHAEPIPPATQTQDTNDIRLTAGVLPDSCPSIPVLISADPESSVVIVDGNDSGFRAPVMFSLSGKHDIQVVADGYEPLSYRLECTSGDSVLLLFTLRALSPPPLAAESLGLAMVPQQAILDSTAADRRMKSFTSAAEMFAVFPFGQGILTRLLGGDAYRKEANALIISGAVLSVSCFIVGKVSSGHQRSNIRAENERISRENNAVLLHNQDVDRKVKLANRERKSRWETENKRRGLVKVQKFP